MRYHFDNSTNNVRNPNQPPKRVQYGPQAADEMAELWLQVLPENKQALATLVQDHSAKLTKNIIEFNEYRLRQNPKDSKAHNKLGQALLSIGKKDEAYRHLREAAEIDPTLDEAHYFMGIIFRSFENLPMAKAAFEKTLQLNPIHAKAHGNLGFVLFELKDMAGAREHFEAALKLNSEDAVAHTGLGYVYFEQQDFDMAAAQFEESLRLNPADPSVKKNLSAALAAKSRLKK
jgi:Flp pilus assembly protein TadD